MATITSTAPGQIVFGTTGGDVITATGAGDVVYGEGGSDTITGGDGGVTINAGFTNDTLASPGQLVGRDTITGGAGNDVLRGGPGNDTINGGAGDDILAGGAGNNALDGGLGVNTASYRFDNLGLTSGVTFNASVVGTASMVTLANQQGGGGVDTLTNIQNVNITGTANADVLTGSASGADQIIGGDGDDALNAGGGPDTLIAFAGNATLNGGRGNDQFVIEDTSYVTGRIGGGHYTVNGGSGSNTLTLAWADLSNPVTVTTSGTSVTASTADGAFTVNATNIASLVVNAGSGCSTVTGAPGPNVLVGGAGNDVIHGGPGNDLISGGAGDNQLFGGGGLDRYLITAPNLLANNTIDASAYNLNGATVTVTNVYGGHDTLTGLNGVEVQGGYGADTIVGGQGDVIVVGWGGDVVRGAGNDEVDETHEGSTFVLTSGGQQVQINKIGDTLDGGAGVNALSFATLHDPLTLDLGAGTATSAGLGTTTFTHFQNIVGGLGDDLIVGAPSGDTLTGGGGHDVFRDTLAGFSSDTITDFNAADRIDVTDASLSSFSYTRVGAALSFGGGTVTLSNDPVGHLIVSADTSNAGGVDLTLGAHMDGLSDFNGDGHSDLLWRNVGSGAFTVWDVGGNGTAANTEAANVYGNGSVGNDWQIQGTLDFNGDGASDLLFRNVYNGGFTVWTASGQGFTANTYVDFSVGTNWSVTGLGDFNGDGRDDLLWRNGNGALTEWQSTGTGFTPNVYQTQVDPSWHVVGVGDFNGDGRDDVLWRNADGALTEWQSNGSGFTQNVFQAQIGTDWHVVAVADFNGDGRADVLFRNDGGAFTEWQSTGNGFVQNVYANGTVDDFWHVVGTGDFNDDGRADILWRNGDGAFTVWESTGSGFVANTLSDATVSNAWTPVTHHYDFV